MVRAPCCEKMGLKKGPWGPEEDQILVSYIQQHGHGNWRALPKLAGLLRCGKSCRLRWINYLRPDIKRGNFTREEEDAIIQLHETLGNRWSAIAAKLPGRTDNEIKNVWHTHLKKKLKQNGAFPKHESSSTDSQPSDSTSTFPESEASQSQAMSPQPSSSEISSFTESSIGTGENNNNSEVKSADTTDFSTDSFPVIDDSFWTDPVPSSSSGESSTDFSTQEFPFMDSIDIESAELLWNDNNNHSMMNMDDGMEFWYDLFVGAGGVDELPDF